MPIPDLVSDRLILRQLLPDDADNVYKLRSDLAINKYLDREPARTIKDARGFIKMISDKVESNKAFYWAIILTETSEFAGTICLFNFSADHKECEIGYELLNGFQSKGIMQEAVTEVIEFAFEKLPVHTIVAESHKENQRSIRLLEKFKFERSLVPDRSSEYFEVFTLIKPQ
jgi:ribosomal-protein-alanine N-acetyltransferase